MVTCEVCQHRPGAPNCFVCGLPVNTHSHSYGEIYALLESQLRINKYLEGMLALIGIEEPYPKDEHEKRKARNAAIRTLRKTYKTSELSRMFGLTRQQINNIARGDDE